MVKQLVCMLTGLLLMAGNATAQSEAIIGSDELRYDFGTIAEENGPASHTFTIRNTGQAPLVITRVTASCGCTMPEWTKAPVAPGQTGEVKVTYDPAGRPGPFVKTVSIYSNGRKGAYMLAIKGNVTPKRAKPVIMYPYAIGPLKMDTKKVLYSSIRPEEALGKKILVTNNSEKAITIHLKKYPDYLLLETLPTTLAPGETGEITVLLNAKAVKKLGRITCEIPVTVTEEGEKKGKEGNIRIAANIIEDFSRLTASDKTNAPAISISTDWLDFSPLKRKGGKVSRMLEITNNGQSPLLIRSITCDDDRIDIGGGKKEIKPGSTAAFKITIRTKEIKSQLEELITIVSNDPSNPVRLIKITAKH